jgi:hypothetical protein
MNVDPTPEIKPIQVGGDVNFIAMGLDMVVMLHLFVSFSPDSTIGHGLSFPWGFPDCVLYNRHSSLDLQTVFV